MIHVIMFGYEYHLLVPVHVRDGDNFAAHVVVKAIAYRKIDRGVNGRRKHIGWGPFATVAWHPLTVACVDEAVANPDRRFDAVVNLFHQL